MSLELTLQDEFELWTAAKQLRPPIVSDDELEETCWMPPSLGKGYERYIDIRPGIELKVCDFMFCQDTILSTPENQHPVQSTVYLSGIADSNNAICVNADRGYLGGSGTQQSVECRFFAGQRQLGVEIHIEPQLLPQLFGNADGALPSELQLLVSGADRPQRVFSPCTTAAIRSVVRQMINGPYVGITKRLYLQGKVLELMALQLAGIAVPSSDNQWALKPETMVQVRRAAVVLRSCVENPPDQTTLAQQVGVSNSTLQRGFKQLFGTTVLGYLTEQRLTLAERLLRDTDMTITEVVHRCGYSNPGHFAAAFKRRFGITPKQCALGMLSEGNG